MKSYWTEFAYSGNPGTGRGGTEVRWQPWGTNADRSIILDTPPPGIHMAADLITTASLKQRLIEDVAITDPHQRCELYAQLFRGESFNKDEYLHLGKEGCAGYGPESFRRF